AVLRQYRREGELVRTTAEAATANASEHRLSMWLAGSLVLRGWAMVEQGVATSGIALLREGLNAWAATGSGSDQTCLRGLLAEALAKEGQFEEALHDLGEAVALIQKRGEGFHEAELHRLRGEFLLRQQASAWGEAEACFRKALTIAQRQQAKSLE